MGSPRRFFLGVVAASLLATMAYAAFVLGTGVWCKADTPQDGVCTWGYWLARLQWWPFARTQALGWLPSWLVRDLGFAVVHPTFWISAAWASVVAIGGVVVGLRHRGTHRAARIPFLVLATVLGIFVLPEIVGPLFLDRSERLAGLALPWPLRLESGLDGPRLAGSMGGAGAWILGGGVVTGAVLGSAVRRGRSFCSTGCPYGALASTLGVLFEGATVRGRLPSRLRGLSVVLLVVATVVTGLQLAGMWGVSGGPDDGLVSHGYRVGVVLGGMGFVGFAGAPLLGPRVWCRWLCPLGGALDLVARRFPSVAVRRSGADCAGCSSCSTACTMGIDVASVVERGDLTNEDGPCISCGFCVDACPEDALALVQLPRRSAA